MSALVRFEAADRGFAPSSPTLTRDLGAAGSSSVLSVPHDRKEHRMHATIRRYDGVDQNRTDELSREGDVSLAPKLDTFPGFADYFVIAPGNGVVSSLGLLESTAQC